MDQVRRLIGCMLLLLGALGSIGGIYGLAMAWNVSGRIDESIDRTAARFDEIIGGIESRSSNAVSVVQGLNRSVEDFNQRVQQRIAKRQDVPVEDAANLAEIESQIRLRLEQLDDLVELTRTSVELMSQVSDRASRTRSAPSTRSCAWLISSKNVSR